MTSADGAKLYEDTKASALAFARDTFAKLRRNGNGSPDSESRQN
jgi:hypothetical protein